MKQLNVKESKVDDFLRALENGLNPNQYLAEAVMVSRIDLLKVFFDYGADIRILFDENTKDTFLSSCTTEIYNYLSLYNLSGNSSDSALEMCLSELLKASYKCRYWAKRGYRFQIKDKISEWSLGLIEKEVLNHNFINNLLEICDIGEWGDRHVNINLDNHYEYYMIATIEGLYLRNLKTKDLCEFVDPLEISPNISHSIRISMMSHQELNKFITEVTFSGNQEIIGISHCQKEHVFFKADGTIGIEIYDQMKNVVSRLYQQMTEK